MDISCFGAPGYQGVQQHRCGQPSHQESAQWFETPNSSAGSGGRRRAKKSVMALIDQIGFDPLDAGPVSESWRYQPGTPAYCSDPTIQQLPKLLGRANPEKAPANRDQAAKLMAKLPADFPPQELVRLARLSARSGHFKSKKLGRSAASRSRASSLVD